MKKTVLAILMAASLAGCSPDVPAPPPQSRSGSRPEADGAYITVEADTATHTYVFEVGV